MTPDQCRAARALVDITQEELSTRAGITRRTVQLFEAGERSMHANNHDAAQRALEKAGVEWISGDKPGVRFAARKAA